MIKWLKQIGLLRREVECEYCNQNMMWNKYVSSSDGYAWRCQVKECAKSARRVSVRKDSFFDKSKISLQDWVRSMYCWSSEMSEKDLSACLNVSRKTAVDMYSFFREVVVVDTDNDPIQIGGPGITVQVGDLCLSESKFHKEKGQKTALWIFGIVNTSITPAIGYVEVIERRDQVTYLQIIEKIVKPGTIIFTDDWLAYRNLINNPNYSHVTVNYPFHFVDPRSGILTQNIESYLGKIKAKVQGMRGCKRDFLTAYLKQFMWMERNKVDRVLKLCDAIGTQFPCL